MNVGIAIKNIRTSTAMNVDEFSRKIGITETHLKEIESGEKQPTLDLLLDIQEVMEIPLSIMLWYSTTIDDFKPEKRITYKIMKRSIDDLLSNLI